MLNIILGPITDLLTRIIPDANKRAELQAEITKTVIENQQSMMDAAKSVMMADSQSESWLTRTARPLVVMWSLFAITFITFVAPLFGIQAEIIASVQAVPDHLWNLVSVGIGGYMLARTAEKAIQAYQQGKK